jgi:thiosulfate dehydrogenase (quinone) large subunit
VSKYAYATVSFGANIMLHGMGRIVMGHAAFFAYLTDYFEKASYVPVSTLSVFATVQPWEETVLGLLLVIGLATRFSLIAGGPLIML